MSPASAACWLVLAAVVLFAACAEGGHQKRKKIVVFLPEKVKHIHHHHVKKVYIKAKPAIEYIEDDELHRAGEGSDAAPSSWELHDGDDKAWTSLPGGEQDGGLRHLEAQPHGWLGAPAPPAPPLALPQAPQRSAPRLDNHHQDPRQHDKHHHKDSRFHGNFHYDARHHDTRRQHDKHRPDPLHNDNYHHDNLHHDYHHQDTRYHHDSHHHETSQHDTRHHDKHHHYPRHQDTRHHDAHNHEQRKYPHDVHRQPLQRHHQLEQRDSHYQHREERRPTQDYREDLQHHHHPVSHPQHPIDHHDRDHHHAADHHDSHHHHHSRPRPEPNKDEHGVPDDIRSWVDEGFEQFRKGPGKSPGANDVQGEEEDDGIRVQVFEDGKEVPTETKTAASSKSEDHGKSPHQRTHHIPPHVHQHPHPHQHHHHHHFHHYKDQHYEGSARHRQYHHPGSPPRQGGDDAEAGAGVQEAPAQHHKPDHLVHGEHPEPQPEAHRPERHVGHLGHPGHHHQADQGRVGGLDHRKGYEEYAKSWYSVMN